MTKHVLPKLFWIHDDPVIIHKYFYKEVTRFYRKGSPLHILNLHFIAFEGGTAEARAEALRKSIQEI